MNEPLSSRDQQGDLNWVTESWNNSSIAVEGLEAPRLSQSNRLDWDWENPMILTHSGAGAGGCSGNGNEDPKAQVLSGPIASSMKPYGGLLSSNFGSSSHSHVELIEPTGIQPFGGLELNHSLLNASDLHGVFGFSNFPGLPSGNITPSDPICMFPNQQHNRSIGALSINERSSNDFMKPNDIYAAEPHARIGLNLGVRTYFSAEDTGIFGRPDKQRRANSPGSLQLPRCQVEGCKAELSRSKRYHRRHKVCELHSKAACVIANGQNQRFCQQCSRFQPLLEFDEGKRSCRKRLADHNRRRRKPQPAVASTSSAGAAAEPLPLKADEQEQSGTRYLHDTFEEH
ncbi:hypothetical protein O6H91_01G067200 [Diphasiastrum complanatum]|uniref:Uncharacterized protein n=1 Tax=Diphasiastrum complanatum TaxID=34168 RepID=A0ACC2ES46_DIPCM|nr:hypothetical protein O6H91_01G067200 [Diphasiastrum complanatum]